MPKIRKAARGKHRWVGLAFSENFSDIKKLKSELQNILGKINFKLYDYLIEGNKGSCIIKIKLEDYAFVRDIFDSSTEILSITASGKIRLVRLRLNNYLQRQIDV